MKNRIISIFCIVSMICTITLSAGAVNANQPEQGFKLGDVTGDGVIDISDALHTLMYVAGMESSSLNKSEQHFNAGLIVSDEYPGIADTLHLLMYVAGMESSALWKYYNEPRPHFCEDKCTCSECECDCIDKLCHDCGECQECVPPIEPLSEEVELKIKQDWLKVRNLEEKILVEDLRIFNLGTYDDCIVFVMYATTYTLVIDTGWDIEIAGLVFEMNNNYAETWHDGEFAPLWTAYDKEWITEQGVRRVWRLWQTRPMDISDLNPPVHITIKGERYSTSLTKLDLSNKGLTDEDIKPLKYMVNLKELLLGGYTWQLNPNLNQISDLSPLAGLAKLEYLTLPNNQISDLSPLANLTNLEMLDLAGNQISDLAPLKGLTNLLYLYLDNNQINDLAPLNKLSNLHELNLNDNQISDLAPLAELAASSSSVEWFSLVLSNNQISDITPLIGWDGVVLHHLSLNNNQISDVSPLANLSLWGRLDLSNNLIYDVSPLSFVWKGLEQIDLRYNYLDLSEPEKTFNFLSKETLEIIFRRDENNSWIHSEEWVRILPQKDPPIAPGNANDWTFSISHGETTCFISFRGYIGNDTEVTLPTTADIFDEIEDCCGRTRHVILGFTALGTEHITTLTIPAGAGDDMSFVDTLDWESLTEINVCPENTAYYSVGGVLFDKRWNVLRCYPRGRTDSSYTVPNGTLSIGGGVFANHEYLTTVIVSDTVTTIYSGAFWGNMALTSVTLGSGVISIGDNVFRDAENLTYLAFKSETPPNFGSNGSFGENHKFTAIHVPIGAGEAYREKLGWDTIEVEF